MANLDKKEIYQKMEQLNMLKEGWGIKAKDIKAPIRASKFGGDIPCLPDDEPEKCHCGLTYRVCAQIYVPGLPSKIRALFPSRLHDALIVLFICPECLEPYDGPIKQKIYHGEEIDKLVYKPLSDPKKFDIQNRVFCGYNSYFTIPHCAEEMNCSELFNIDDDAYCEAGRYKACYFGGHPDYCQGDENPGEDFRLILSIADCNSFTLMWGDAGNAQIWLRNDDSDEFYITWSCC